MLTGLQKNLHGLSGEGLPYSRHGVSLLYEMIDALRRCSSAEMSCHDHIAWKTLSAVVRRTVGLTLDWEGLRREPQLHTVIHKHSFVRKGLVIVVTEVPTRHVVATRRDDWRASLQSLLTSMPRDDQQLVTCVATDVKDSYQCVVLTRKPTVRLFGQPFHVVRLAMRLPP